MLDFFSTCQKISPLVHREEENIEFVFFCVYKSVSNGPEMRGNVESPMTIFPLIERYRPVFNSKVTRL